MNKDFDIIDLDQMDEEQRTAAQEKAGIHAQVLSILVDELRAAVHEQDVEKAGNVGAAAEPEADRVGKPEITGAAETAEAETAEEGAAEESAVEEIGAEEIGAEVITADSPEVSDMGLKEGIQKHRRIQRAILTKRTRKIMYSRGRFPWIRCF